MSVDRCICCGEIVPEGRMVCNTCEYKVNECYYKQNPDKFVEDYFNIKLLPHQKLFLKVTTKIKKVFFKIT